MLNTLNQFHRTGMHRTGSRSSHRVASTTPGSPHPHGVTTPTRHTHTREYRFPPGCPNHQPGHRARGQHPPYHTGVIATTCSVCRCSPSRCFYMCAHGCGAPHPHWRTVHPILGVLTHIIDPCLYSPVYIFVYATSYTFDTTLANRTLPPHNSTTHHARPTDTTTPMVTY